MKTCTKCTERKPLNDFYKQNTYADGYQTICKRCVVNGRKMKELYRKLALMRQGQGIDPTKFESYTLIT